MKFCPGTVLASVRRFSAICVLAVVPLTAGASGAHAQSGVDLSTDHVTVDLSVIEGAGRGRGPAPAPYVIGPRGTPSGGGLLMPGPRNPRSTLHVVVPKGKGMEKVTLRPPGSKPKKQPKRVAKPKPPKAKPEKHAPPPVAATEPPAALTTSPPPKPTKEMAKAAPPAPPPAAAKPAAPPRPEKKEQAALPPPTEAIKTGRAMQVAFGPQESKLPADFKDALKALAGKVKNKENLRLQLMAYAGGKNLSPSKARRMSLSRALSVRSFLIESGVRSTRIDVRALGGKTSEEPLNRVDVNIVER
ncbi:MAG: OmpA family protein [Rhodospirillales bacterium]